MYQRPYSIEEIKENYPDKAEMLLSDPAHLWRAETGIELIHQEPTLGEQERIYKNWNEMTDEMKKKSDEKSIDIFRIDNLTHHEEIMQSRREQNNKEAKRKDKARLFKFAEIFAEPITLKSLPQVEHSNNLPIDFEDVLGTMLRLKSTDKMVYEMACKELQDKVDSQQSHRNWNPEQLKVLLNELENI